MGTALHTDLPKGEIHIPHQWEFANAGARLAAGPFVPEDKYKLALQLDNYTLWMLLNNDPATWMQITAEDPENISNLKFTARKATAGTIGPGVSVYVVDYDVGADEVLVEIADADDAAKMPAVGITEGTLTAVSAGVVVVYGPMGGFNTSLWTPNTPLYVPTDGTGIPTNTRPSGFNSKVQVIASVFNQATAPNGVIVARTVGALAWPNLTERYVAVGQAGDGVPTERDYNHGHADASDGGTLPNTQRGVQQSNVFYVGKHGSDSADGKSIETAFLTFGKAITAINAIGASAVNPFAIICNDGGIYTEDITVPSFVELHAASATLSGVLSISDSCSAQFGTLVYTGGADAVRKATGTGTGSVKLDTLNCTALSSNGIVCSSGTLLFHVEYLSVNNGIGIGGASSQRVVGYVGQLKVANNGYGISLLTSGAYGDISIEQLSAPNGTGIACSAGTHAHVRIGTIEATTAWNVAAGGKLYGVFGDVDGARTNNGEARMYIGKHHFAYIAENAALATTSSLTPVNRLTVNIPATEPSGRYKISWDCSYYYTDDHCPGYLLRIQQGGVTIREYDVAPQDKSAIARYPLSGFAVVQHAAGAEAITLDWWSSDAGKVAGIADARLLVEKMCEAEP